MCNTHHHPTASKLRPGRTASLLLGGLIIDHLFFQLVLISIVGAQQPLDSDYEMDLLRRLLTINRNTGSQIFGGFAINPVDGTKQRQAWQLSPFPLFSTVAMTRSGEKSRPLRTEDEAQLIVDDMPKRNIAIGRGDGFRPG